ncbi:MAG: dihydrofolate reductase [Alistipes sp.]|jgi:dihydrofolate reductase|nr:dihydrofolate reductase [Alistipes sp.]
MVSVIVAVADGGVIGCGGAMPWHISEDLRMFKRVTGGHPVAMGRRTFESLRQPLPGRTNVVVTRNPRWSAPGVLSSGSLQEAVTMFPPEEEVFVIGGGEIYREAMPLADRFYLTRIHAGYDGDTFFPAWDAADWSLVSSEYHERGANYPNPFEFQILERK